MNYFQNKNFWFFYHGLGDFEPDYLHSIGVAERFDKKGNPMPVEFQLDCGPRFRLELLIWIETWGMELWLTEKKTDTAKQLGWWDGSEWHPFCFHWDELMELIEYWSKDSANPPKDALICMLARFAGNSPDEPGGKQMLSKRRELVRKAYQNLGVENKEIEQLMTESFVVLDEYHWEKNPKLGWLFTGEYACYSIRNLHHLKGKNEFPFDWYNSMLADLKK